VANHYPGCGYGGEIMKPTFGGCPELEKLCPHCETRKPLISFNKHKRNVTGLQSWCRECTQKAVRECKKRKSQILPSEGPPGIKVLRLPTLRDLDWIESQLYICGDEYKITDQAGHDSLCALCDACWQTECRKLWDMVVNKME